MEMVGVAVGLTSTTENVIVKEEDDRKTMMEDDKEEEENNKMLAMPPNKHTNTIFRVHIGFLNGAIIALLFPPTQDYILPMELETFYIEHILMVIAPLYLSTLGDPYTSEPLSDYTYTLLSVSVFILYHTLILQPISLLTGVNVDYILCPPSSLPSFMSGPHYLLQCAWTQTLVIAGVHKTMTLAVRCLGRCVGHETYLYHYQVDDNSCHLEPGGGHKGENYMA